MHFFIRLFVTYDKISLIYCSDLYHRDGTNIYRQRKCSSSDHLSWCMNAILVRRYDEFDLYLRSSLTDCGGPAVCYDTALCKCVNL